MSSPDCIICQKHQNLAGFVGEPILERAGMVLAHFPYLESEKATKGHLILEPRRHITDLTELSDDEASALGMMARAGAHAICSILKADHVYFFRINDKVQHLHFHLIPRYPGTPKEYWGTRIMEFPDRPVVDLEQIRHLAKRLRIQ